MLSFNWYEEYLQKCFEEGYDYMFGGPEPNYEEGTEEYVAASRGCLLACQDYRAIQAAIKRREEKQKEIPIVGLNGTMDYWY